MRGSRVYKVVRGRYRVVIEERYMRDGSRSLVFATRDEKLAHSIAEELRRLGLQPRVYTDKYGYWRIRVVVPRGAVTQTVAAVA